MLYGFCRAQHHERDSLREELEQLQATIRQREKERDSALQELFLRFSEDGKLSKEKSQFQAKLAEYEKYAALTQLALGAAHEINNPLLGILSHLELELKNAPPEGCHEIEQCIEAARRISGTLRSLMNYAAEPVDPEQAQPASSGRGDAGFSAASTHAVQTHP